VLELDGEVRSATIMHTEADAIVSACSDLACGVRTADCLPILIADRATGRAAAAHAGWRGLVNRVIEATTTRLGGDPRDWVAAIGPHIRTAAFEVSEDVARELETCSDAINPCVRQAGSKPRVNLAHIARAQLLSFGVPPMNVELVGGCTRDEPADYFSFRRDGRHGGRHLSCIVPRSGS
jgi:YfiH family protein